MSLRHAAKADVSMPKATTSKPKFKPQPKAAKSSPPASSPPAKPKPKSTASRETMVQILLAKVENSKTLDWFELSVRLNGGSAVSEHGGKGKKKRDSGGESGEGLSGSELREVFQETLLPALKRGMLPWEEDGFDTDSPGPITPEPRHGDVQASQDGFNRKGGKKKQGQPKKARAKPSGKGAKAVDAVDVKLPSSDVDVEVDEDEDEMMAGDFVEDFEEEEIM